MPESFENAARCGRRRLSILDFGSGEGITADHYAENNSVTAVEPSEEMLSSAWKDHEYKQIIGDVSVLSEYSDHSCCDYESD